MSRRPSDLRLDFLDGIITRYQRNRRAMCITTCTLPSCRLVERRMTASDKKMIRDMRQSGKSYGQIALALNVSENTVKSFCRRESISTIVETFSRCSNCNKPIAAGTHGEPRCFCSDTCRYAWNFAHRVLAEHNAISKHCAGCGKAFFSYASSGRKYCSHVCYMNFRYEKRLRHGA